MKIQAQLLNTKQHLAQLQHILISGNDEYLIEQSILSIRSSLKIQDLTIIQTYQIDELEKRLAEIYAQTNNGSLFGEPTILMLQSSKALLKKQHELITQLLNECHDTFFIFTLPKLTKAQEKQAWINQVAQTNLHITADPVQTYKLPQLIQAKMQHVQLQTTREGYKLLACSFEGNLRALDQEIEKLALIFEKGMISIQQLHDNISQQAQYNIFQCVDFAIDQQIAKLQSALAQVKRDKAQPHIILWAVIKELRNLINMKFEIDNKGRKIPEVLNAFHVWQSKHNMFSKQLKQRSIKEFYHLLQLAKSADESIKGLTNIDPWQSLSHILLQISTEAHATTS